MPLTTTSGRKLPGMNQMPTGNVLKGTDNGTRGGGRVKAGTQNITYASPGQPLSIEWDGTQAIEAYFQSIWVHRCVRTIAETAAMLPFLAGRSQFNPESHNPRCRLAALLGPPQPGVAIKGPNPHTAARALFCWSIVQYIVTGKFGWEAQLGADSQTIVGLWPLVSAALTPIPSMGGTRYWDGFQYQTPYGIIDLEPKRVVYAWRPSQRDWRQPESVLEAARSPISLEVGIERFMNGLLKNGLTAAHVVITPPFEEPEMRRAWQEQFMQEFTGFDNSGKTIFGEAELAEKDQRIPNIQIQQVGTRPVDAQLLQMWQQTKVDVCVALGVPESLIGNASDRTFSNADSEYRNFWTITMLQLITEIQEAVNTELSPRVGDEVGWFDLSKVAALQGPSVFAQLAPDKAVAVGIAPPDRIAELLGITEQALDIGSSETEPIGEEAVLSGPSGTGAGVGSAANGNDRGDPMAVLEFRIRELADRAKSSTALSSDLADKVYGYLARNYPRRTIDWVHDADWERRRVPLDEIQMERRPGGARDQEKVAGIANAIEAGQPMHPVVLVDAGDDKLRIADGYHRALAHRRANEDSIDAFVGKTAESHGPWEEEMHARKLNRAMEYVDRALRDPERRSIIGLPKVSGVPKAPPAGTVYPPELTPRTEPHALEPTPAPHAFQGNNLTMCSKAYGEGICGQPVLSPIHLAYFADRDDRGGRRPLASALPG